VTLHGSWNRLHRTGYKVIRLLFDGTGHATGEYEDFMTGFVVTDKTVWGRPVGVAVGKDGSLFVDGGRQRDDLARHARRRGAAPPGHISQRYTMPSPLPPSPPACGGRGSG
jgi:glucose/arabinose dehydrogenase